MTERSICVVTQPLSAIGETTTGSLLDILSEIATVTLITANLGVESELREQYEVVDVSSKGTGESIPTTAIRFVVNQLRMAAAVWRRDEEIVLFFGGTAYLVPIVAGKLSGKTVILEPRGDVSLTLRLYWERRIPGPLARVLAGTVWLLERIGFRLADEIIVYTPGVADQLGLDSRSDTVHTDGARCVDTDEFYPRVPFEERGQVVGFLGRLGEEKGIRTLAEVAKQLPEDVTFRFVGDGDLREWLETELAEEIQAGRVEVVGWVDHDRVPKELSRMRLLVMPSAPTEGLPTVILEAMACGTPVYATPVSGVPDVVREGETGFLLTESGAGEIAERVDGILDREDLPAVGSAAGELIDDEYTFEWAVDRYERILVDIAG